MSFIFEGKVILDRFIDILSIPDNKRAALGSPLEPTQTEEI
jgi:hypothetical protein